MEQELREALCGKRRIVIKIGSSSLTHEGSGALNLGKIEALVRVISDLRGAGKEVVLVSSGAIAAGRQALHHPEKPESLAQKQAFAAPCAEAGLCGCWAGPSYDGISEVVCRV